MVSLWPQQPVPQNEDRIAVPLKRLSYNFRILISLGWSVIQATRDFAQANNEIREVIRGTPETPNVPPMMILLIVMMITHL